MVDGPEAAELFRMISTQSADPATANRAMLRIRQIITQKLSVHQQLAASLDKMRPEGVPRSD